MAAGYNTCLTDNRLGFIESPFNGGFTDEGPEVA